MELLVPFLVFIFNFMCIIIVLALEVIYEVICMFFNNKNMKGRIYEKKIKLLFIMAIAYIGLISNVSALTGEVLRKENDDDYKIYKEILDMDSKIKIEYVNYSHNELNAVNNNVSDYMTLKDINNDNVQGTYIDVMNNAIVVEVLENNDKEKNIKGLVKSNLGNDKGDSGGVVLIPLSGGKGEALPIGVVSGGSKGLLGIGRSMYFTSIYDVLSQFLNNRY